MRISLLQARQPKSIIRGMRVLIFVLLASLTAEAQGIADVARQERERRAQAANAHVFTGTDAPAAPAANATTAATAPGTTARSTTPKDGSKPSTDVKADPKAKPETTAKAETDPAEQWRAQIEQLRGTIRQLQDQETAVQLQANEFTNQFYAPVTTTAARNQAQADLADAQKKLVDVRKELAQTRLKLQQLEAEGPPKK
jgi:hypothetical protein